MDTREFLGLEPVDGTAHWQMPVVPAVSTGGGFLFGGCALAAAVAAIEGATERPLVWATAQYLSYARPGSILDIDVTIAVSGHQISQARAVGRVGDSEIFTVNAAVGSRPFEARGMWAERPDVPPPNECRVRALRDQHAGTIMDQIDMRLAYARDFTELDGTRGTGRSSMWARLPNMLEPSAAALSVLGDWVPFGIGQSLGERAGGNSLDNTIRVVRIVPTEWILLDIRVHAVESGFGHGLVHLWAEDGTLLGTASQSAIVRYWKE